MWWLLKLLKDPDRRVVPDTGVVPEHGRPDSGVVPEHGRVVPEHGRPDSGVVPEHGRVVPEHGRPDSGVVPEHGRVVPEHGRPDSGVVPEQGSQFRGSDNVVPEHTTEKAKKEAKKEPKLKKEVKKEPRSPKSPSSLVTGKSKRSLQVFQTMKQLAAKSKPAPKAKEPKQRQLGCRPK